MSEKENMMKGYWVVLGAAVTDTEAQQTYGALWAPIAAKYQARLITGGSSLDLREGPGIARALLVEFPSLEMAQACYDDPDYRQALPFALRASNRHLIVLEGEIK